MLSAFADVTISDLESSGAGELPEDSFALPLLASTPLKTTQQLTDDSFALDSISFSQSQSPTHPAYSPLQGSTTMSFSSGLSHENPHQDQSKSETEDIQPQTPVPVLTPPDTANTHSQTWSGFKIVGDSIDKTIHPRRQRFDQQTKSLHYFNIVAVRDRVDFSNFSDVNPNTIHSQAYKVEALLPTEDDLRAIRVNFSVLVSRVLVQYVPGLKQLEPAVQKHIKHQYHEEMSQCSEVVSKICTILQYWSYTIAYYF